MLTIWKYGGSIPLHLLTSNESCRFEFAAAPGATLAHPKANTTAGVSLIFHLNWHWGHLTNKWIETNLIPISSALEPHRRPEPEPAVTLRADAHQEAVMLAATCNRVPNDGAHETKHDRTDGYPFR